MMMSNTVENNKAKIPSLYDLPERKISWLESFLGPEFYRMVQGIFSTPISIVGLLLIAFFILVAILAPVIAPPYENARSPYTIPRDGYGPVPQTPGSVWTKTPPPLPFWWQAIEGTTQWKHLFGTTSGQWDIFYGVIWGTRTAILIGVLIVAATVIIGVIVGAISAFYGGFVDNLLMRVTEIFMTFPFLMAALTLSAVHAPVIGKGIWPATIALVTFGWMTYARLVRGDVLSIKEREFIMAARVTGAKDMRLLRKHIIPNAIYPTIVLASMDVGNVVIGFAALSFLGVGVEVGYADWGQLISFARNFIPQLFTYWYILVFPGITLIFFVMGFNLMGDALRDIMDPRMRGRGA
jgi:peptide/nickel transport system permease protein